MTMPGPRSCRQWRRGGAASSPTVQGSRPVRDSRGVVSGVGGGVGMGERELGRGKFVEQPEARLGDDGDAAFLAVLELA